MTAAAERPALADHAHMAMALRLARRGLQTTTPNPRVGCVLVRAGEVVGRGWHERAGAPHAEANALREAGARAHGATAYVTLEPCSHHGRTPPCADALIEAGVARVVAAMQDPNPLVAGQGLARLATAGVDVACGLLASEAEELNVGFIRRMRSGRPWVRAKMAVSLDGRSALADGRSQWLTGAPARRDGHRWRARACAILTGMGTVRADDPELTVREVPTTRQPLRVVLDTRLELSETARLVSSARPDRPVLVATAVEDESRHGRLRRPGLDMLCLPAAQGYIAPAVLLSALAGRGVNELHVEAGARLTGALLSAGLVDELLLYQALCLVGDGRGIADLPTLLALGDAPRLRLVEQRWVGADLRLRLRPT